MSMTGRVRMRTHRIVLGVGALLLAAGACQSIAREAAPATPATPAATPSPPTTPAATPAAASPWEGPAHGPGHLRPGSDPSVLPSSVLIADNANNRLVVIDPQGRVRWQFPRPSRRAHPWRFQTPDDGFFTPDGKQIVATEAAYSVVRVIDSAGKITHQHGTPGVPGAGGDRLSNPDDAMMLPDGRIVVADIKNCRILVLSPTGRSPQRQLGQTGVCAHDPPRRFGSPNGIFPLRNGHFLVTEINGNWVDEIDLDGHVYWSTHPPGVSYPSDANQIGPDRYVVVDWSTPGQIVVFNRAGKRLWRFGPSGAEALDHPSVAFGLPNGDIFCTDDENNRVIVVDPRTNKIAWQYGHTGKAGNGPGYLHWPDGADLLPPYSLHSPGRR